MTRTPRLRVAIVGSGIGGLSLAVALNKLGIADTLEIDIYEAATKLAQVGAGITVWPRAWDILKKLGLEEALEKRSPASEDALQGKQVIGFSYRKGDQKQGVPIVDVKLPGGPRAFHRADVQQVLLEYTSASTKIHFLHRLKEYTKTLRGIELVFENGTTAMCDFLIGADGINSVVRKLFVRDEDKFGVGCANKSKVEVGCDKAASHTPRWTGTFAYRGLIEAELVRKECPEHPGLRSPIVYCGKNKHIVMYPILNGRYINTIHFVSDPSKEGSHLTVPAVVNSSDDDVAGLYKGWEDNVQSVVKNLVKPSRWAIHTVGPLERYAFEDVFLLGDAAHAMAPHLGNGAAQAIEDAYILAHLLAKGLHQRYTDTNVSSRITEAYNSVRQPFANAVVIATRNQGRRYELNTSQLEDVAEGDFVSRGRLVSLGKEIQKGWEWTWKTRVDCDLERALAVLDVCQRD